MNQRFLTVLIAILSTLATVGATLTSPESAYHLSPPYALLVGALGSGIYAMIRALQKLKEGASLKGLLSTTEAWGTMLVCAASVVGAVGGVIPVQYSATAIAISAILLKIGRVAIQIDSAGPGAAGPGPGPFGPAAVLIFFLVLSGQVHAQVAPPTPQLGGCNEAGTLCFAPAVAISALQVNLVSGEYERVALNVGYGATYKGLPVNVGVALYGGVGISAKSPNAPQANLLISVADIGAIGPGVQTFTDPSDGKRVWQGLLTIAVNYNIGGSFGYLEQMLHKQEKALRAERACSVPKE